MTAYDLPTSLVVGGVEHPIRTGWRVVMDIFAMYNDPDFDNEMKTVGLVKMIYPQWREIPPEAIPEAIEKACDFLDCGQKPDSRHRPRLVDWEDDAAIIIPAVNGVAGQDVRSDPDIHWWTFFGWYMSIKDSLFSTVLHIRKKQNSGKKLERWENEFLRENQKLVHMKTRLAKEELEYLKRMGGGQDA